MLGKGDNKSCKIMSTKLTHFRVVSLQEPNLSFQIYFVSSIASASEPWANWLTSLFRIDTNLIHSFLRTEKKTESDFNRKRTNLYCKGACSRRIIMKMPTFYIAIYRHRGQKAKQTATSILEWLISISNQNAFCLTYLTWGYLASSAFLSSEFPLCLPSLSFCCLAVVWRDWVVVRTLYRYNILRCSDSSTDTNILGNSARDKSDRRKFFSSHCRRGHVIFT